MGKYDPAPTFAAGLVRTARAKANMTQTELGNAAGIKQQAVSAYETGRIEPTLPTLQRLVAAAGFELRVRLEPLNDHDASVTELLESLPRHVQAQIEQEQRERVETARLRRVRGK